VIEYIRAAINIILDHNSKEGTVLVTDRQSLNGLTIVE